MAEPLILQPEDEPGRIGRVRSAILAGIGASVVTVEVYRGMGLPRETIVGLAGSAVRESLERIHAACAHGGMRLRPRRTTINLAPAGWRKTGAALDLPIALALLLADDAIPTERLAGALCVGELGLDGTVRAGPGVLPACLAARGAGIGTVLVPPGNAAEATALGDLRVLVVHSLAAAAAWARGEHELDVAQPPPPRPDAGVAVNLADVRGQELARRTLEIAAAGGHHLLMSGPPGAGKTLLARALIGILPELTADEAIETSAVHSVIGSLVGRGLLRQPPLRAPHHSVSVAGLVGGGTPLRPGEISLATHGVLFLDELPEFPRAALESLRQPLEEGRVSIARAAESFSFPARFQLVAAMNECPCGRGPGDAGCACGELEVGRYWKRVSGPLLDRIDLFVAVDRVPLKEIAEGSGAEPSSAVRARVAEARARQLRRAGSLNAHLPPRALPSACSLPADELRDARRRADSLGLSARAWHRALRVARTIADLAGAESVERDHVLEALQFRPRVPLA